LAVSDYAAAVVADSQTMLVDSTMNGATRSELSIAVRVHEALSQSTRVNQQMATNLTVYGTVPAEHIVPAFEASRRQMHQAEMRVRSLLAASVVGRYYPSEGYGRTWPYMDASQSDEGQAYGRELAALRSHNVKVPFDALHGELASLRARQATALAISERFMRLSGLEAPDT
jgi:hypothetical protein